jgi:hypothetical protein
MSADPNITVATAAPVAWNPNRTPKRRPCPAASHPNPSTMPCPIARRPNELRTRSGYAHFDLGRGRRFGNNFRWLFRPGFDCPGWRRRLPDVNCALHTTRKNHRHSRNCQSRFIRAFHILFPIDAIAVPFVQSLCVETVVHLSRFVVRLFR